MNTRAFVGLALLLLALLGMFFFYSFDREEVLILKKSQFSFSPPENVSRETALDALLDIQEVIRDLNDYGLSTHHLEELLFQAQLSYIGNQLPFLEEDALLYLKNNDEFKRNYIETLKHLSEQTPKENLILLDYTQVFYFHQQTLFIQEQAYRLLDTLPLVEEKEKTYSQKGISAPDAHTLLQQARDHFLKENYDEAEITLLNADSALNKAHADRNPFNFFLRNVKNFFIKYSWQIFFALLSLLLLFLWSMRKFKKHHAKQKLNSLYAERKGLEYLIIEAQKDCFQRQNITQSAYQVRVEQYRKRIAEIQSQITFYDTLAHPQAKKRGILQFLKKSSTSSHKRKK
ncbi:hypothetical protein J4410_05370 [Candidatus Woesearchaeota archaeon]|nr:hypothetical protein [Candidatus Woesearchaeota archaeon]